MTGGRRPGRARVGKQIQTPDPSPAPPRPTFNNHPGGLYFSASVEYASRDRPDVLEQAIMAKSKEPPDIPPPPTTDIGTGFDPKHSGKNANHPNKPGSATRTGLTDQELKDAANFGAWGADRWFGVEVRWQVIVGAQADGPLRYSADPEMLKIVPFGPPDKHGLAICAIATGPGVLGAAMHMHGKIMSVPYEAAWVETELSPKAIRAVWRKFKQFAECHRFPPERTVMLMGFEKGPPIRVLADGYDEKLNLEGIPSDEEGLQKFVWEYWNNTRELWLKHKKRNHNFWLKEAPEDCPFRFPYERQPENCHPAVLASAVAYTTMLQYYHRDFGLRGMKRYQPS